MVQVFMVVKVVQVFQVFMVVQVVQVAKGVKVVQVVQVVHVRLWDSGLITMRMFLSRNTFDGSILEVSWFCDIQSNAILTNQEMGWTEWKGKKTHWQAIGN